MASNVNVVAICGNLTRDPELRHTAGGTAVCSLRVAVNGSEKDPNGEWQDRADFFDVTVWGRQGESCAEYLEKGRPVGISGRLRFEQWDADDGTKRSAVKIVADRVQFLGSRADGESTQRQAPAATGGDEWDYKTPTRDDDIPF